MQEETPMAETNGCSPHSQASTRSLPKNIHERQDDTIEEPPAKRARKESSESAPDVSKADLSAMESGASELNHVKDEETADMEAEVTEVTEVQDVSMDDTQDTDINGTHDVEKSKPNDVEANHTKQEAPASVKKEGATTTTTEAPSTAMPADSNGVASKSKKDDWSVYLLPGREQEPLTQTMVKEAKKALAGIKKTKVGAQLCKPIEVTWPSVAAQYNQVISQPMHFGIIDSNLKEGKYGALADLKADLHLVYSNAFDFNGSDHVITVQSHDYVKRVMEALKAASLEKARPIRKESTPKLPTRSKDPDHTSRSAKKIPPELKFYEGVLKEMMSPKYGDINAPFLAPVDPVALNIPTYFKVIKKPMDLSTIRQKLEAGEYKKSKDFEADVTLMFKNCFRFNPIGNPVHEVGRRFEEVYKQLLSKKDVWAKDNAAAPHPTPASAKSRVVARPDPDSEVDESETEPASAPPTVVAPNEAEDALKMQQNLVKRIDNLLKEQTRKLTEEVNKPIPDETSVRVCQMLVTNTTNDLIQEKKKLAEMDKKKASAQKTAKAKAAKPRTKTTNNVAPKKTPTAPRKSTSAPKKAATSAHKKRPLAGVRERETVTSGILTLDDASMQQCIEIIKRDTNQMENDDNELELDVQVLSSDAVWMLYDIITEKAPAAVAAVPAAQSPGPPSPQRHVAKAARPKKNKPMNKQEQERKIKQLKELKAKFQQGQAAGSQDVANGSAEEQSQAQDAEDDSDDEPSDSEEE